MANVPGLRWGEDDIVDVARHLNTIHYHFPTSKLKDYSWQ